MTDTSKEAVERLAQGIADNLGGIIHGDADVSATLRALSAERDALQAKLDEAVKALEVVAETDGCCGDVVLCFDCAETADTADTALSKIRSKT